MERNLIFQFEKHEHIFQILLVFIFICFIYLFILFVFLALHVLLINQELEKENVNTVSKSFCA